MDLDTPSEVGRDAFLGGQEMSYFDLYEDPGSLSDVQQESQPAGTRRITKSKSKGKAGKARRSRAAQACHCCRERKVRCDVLTHGVPCTKCNQAGEECILSLNKRCKKTNQPLPPNTEASDGSGSASNPHDLWAPANIDTSYQVGGGPYRVRYHEGGAGPPIFQSFKERKAAEKGARTADTRANNSLYMTAIGYCPSPPVSVSSDSSEASRENDFCRQPRNPSSFRQQILPSYFHTVPDSLGKDDFEYLRGKGVFTLPNTTLRNQLLEAYSEFIHGYVPVLNLPEFSGIIQKESSGKISLLIFHAVMFAGSASVKIEHLQSAGFTSRRHARTVLWQKTKLLYDFDYESNQISLAQALLLMSFWYETSSTSKNAGYWTDLAINVARNNGFNKDRILQKMDSAQQKTCRLIWWSCVTRDQLVALGTQRLAQIRQNEYDVPALTLNDFQIDASESPTTAEASERQKQVAVLFMEMTKLCVCVAKIMNDQPSIDTHDEASLQEGSPKDIDQASADLLHICDAELDAWLRDLPPSATYRPITPMDLLLHGDDRTVVTHLSLLHMLYHAVVSTLHRPWLHQGSLTKVRSAADSITGVLENLRRLDLVRYIPVTSFTFITPALTIHLMDQKSSDPTIRQCATEDFAKCMRAMRELSEHYEQSASTSRPTHPEQSEQSEKERLRALNPGPGMSFYSIMDDVTSLLPIHQAESAVSEAAAKSGPQKLISPSLLTNLQDMFGKDIGNYI